MTDYIDKNMRKIYCKPATKVFDIETTQILCGSERYPGPFGQIPGESNIEDSVMA